jgi:hypothetical protein
MARDRGKFILASKALFFSVMPGSEIFGYAAEYSGIPLFHILKMICSSSSSLALI